MSADFITMTDAQCLVIERMSGDLGYPIADIASETGVPERECRRIIRGFHSIGAADFGPLYDDDDGLLRGRGYWLSEDGWRAREMVRKLIPWQALESMATRARGEQS